MRQILILMIATMLLGCRGVIDEEANAQFGSRSDAFTVSVYPVHVVVSPDAIMADTSLQSQVTHYLNEKDYARAVAAVADVSVPVTWGHDQSKMFRTSATTFAQNVQGQITGSDYALLVEVLCLGQESNVGGIHFYLVDNQGRVVACALSNSHWESFTSVMPDSRQKGLKVAFNLFDEFLSLEP